MSDTETVDIAVFGGPFDGVLIRVEREGSDEWTRLLLPRGNWIHVHDYEQRPTGEMVYAWRSRLRLVMLERKT